jgi:hypothetical protein
MPLAPPVPTPAPWLMFLEPSQPHTRTSRVGAWKLDVTYDPFTGLTGCRLRGSGITYDGRAVTFQLPRRINTFEAQYRVDYGPVISWRSNAVTLARSGAALQDGPLSNPSAGRVLTPLSTIITARMISIQAAPGAPERLFRLNDLRSALDVAKASKCGPAFDPDQPATGLAGR